MSIRDYIPDLLDGENTSETGPTPDLEEVERELEDTGTLLTDGHGEIAGSNTGTEQPLLTRRQALGGIGAVLAGGAGAGAATREDNRNPSNNRKDKNKGAIAATTTATATATQTPENTSTQTSTTTETATSTPQGPDHYRIDMISPGEKPRTSQEWDDFHFQPDRIQSLAENWNQQVTYTQLVDRLRENSEATKEKYDGDKYGWDFPNEENDDNGNWDLNDFQETTNSHDILKFGATSIMIYQNFHLNGAPSTENDWFAATLNTIINDLYQPESNEKFVETGYVDQGGHGTVFAHTKTENTPLESKNNWFWIDTVDDDVRTLDHAVISTGYNPLVQGYQPEPQTEQGYTDEKDIAENALTSLINVNHTPEEFNGNKISFTDQLLDDIYNTHIRENDGDVEPVLNVVEQAADYQIQTGERIQIYGDSLDDVRFAAGGPELYQLSMDPDTHLTTEAVEEFIAAG